MYNIIKVLCPFILMTVIKTSIVEDMVKENIQYLVLQPANLDEKTLLTRVLCNYIKCLNLK